MKKKINYKIGGYLLMAVAFAHCTLLTVEYWAFILHVVSSTHGNILGMLGDNPTRLAHNLDYNIGLGYFYGMFAGFWWFVAGVCCAWVERKLNRPIPLFISLLILLIGVIGVPFLSPYSHFPYPEIVGPWLFIYISLYMIICNVLGRRAKRVS